MIHRIQKNPAPLLCHIEHPSQIIYLVSLHESEMQAALVRKDLELSRNELALLRQQIRPHFVFNSLHMIKSLIRTDREKAMHSIENFIRIPALTVEPLVENAIRHGLSGGGKVSVSTYREGDDIVISVSGNCSGFLLKPVSRSQLKKAFENLRKPFLDIPLEYYAEHYRGGDVIES